MRLTDPVARHLPSRLPTLALTVAAVWLVQSFPAQALTVANHDDDAAMVVIIANGEEQAYELAPGETVTDLCKSGCTAIFGNGEEITMTGTETVAIENDAPRITSSN